MSMSAQLTHHNRSYGHTLYYGDLEACTREDAESVLLLRLCIRTVCVFIGPGQLSETILPKQSMAPGLSAAM